MPVLDLDGTYATDTRPARKNDGRGLWAKDPSSALSDDGTRLDATFVNDLIGLLRGTFSGLDFSAVEGDDSALANAIINAISARIAPLAPKDSPTFTGAPIVPTPNQDDNSQRIASTEFVVAFVSAAVAALVNSSPAALDTLNELAAALGDDANFAATMTNALALKAPLASPALTGTPTSPDVTAGDNSTKIANTAFVASAVAAATAVSSVFGRSGAVSLQAGDITALGLAGSALASSIPMINGTVVASVSGNALTLAIKTLAGNDPSASDPVYFIFRDAAAALGDYVVRTVTAALSITVPSGKGIGTANGVPFAFWLEAIDNAGTVELAVYNSVVGAASPTQVLCPNEAARISTTAISSGTSGATHYSTTARTNVPFRMLARLEYTSGLSTAGTWASVPVWISLFGPGMKKPGDVVQSRAKMGNAQFSTTSSSAQTTNNSDAISPTSAANLVRVRCCGFLQCNSISVVAYAQLYRGSTSLAGIAAFQNQGAGGLCGVALEALDAPGVASSTGYSEKIFNSNNSTTILTGSSENFFLDEIMV